MTSVVGRIADPGGQQNGLPVKYKGMLVFQHTSGRDRGFFQLSDLHPSRMAYAQANSGTAARLSVNQVTTIRWNLEQIVVACQETGINSIGVWRRKLEEFGEERGIDFLLESELHVSSLSWAGGFTGSHGWASRKPLKTRSTPWNWPAT